MNRRDALKLLAGTALTSSAVLANAKNTPNGLLEYVPDPSRIPQQPTSTTVVENAPER